MNPIRYRAGKAIRWLQTSAAQERKNARKGSQLVTPQSAKDVGANLKVVAEAIAGFGKSAWTEHLHSAANEQEYLLLEDALEIHSAGPTKNILYKDIEKAEQRGDKVVFYYEKGSVTVKPVAYIVAGRIKAPVGWERNGVEVPFETFIEELCARCGIGVVEL